MRYFSRAADDTVCPALLDELEEHAQVIGDALGIERPLVTYYKYADGVDFGANGNCGAGESASRVNATVNSTASFDRHELIHAYLGPYGLPPRLFMEGAAVALSCQRYPRPTGSWRDALTADRFSPQLYGAGGWLVGYLMRMFRKTWFVNLYGSLQSSKRPPTISTRCFQGHLQDVARRRLGRSDHRQAGATVCPWVCARPAFEADGQAHALSTVCDGGTTQLTVDVPGEGVMRWLLDGDASFFVGSCSGDDRPQHAISGGNGTGALLAPLSSGRYFIDAAINKGATPTLSIDTNALAALSSSDCAAAPAVPDDLSQYSNLTLFLPSSAGAQFTTFASGSARDAVLSVTSDDPSATARLCDSCDAQTCTATGVGGGLGADIPTGKLLSVPAGPTVTATIIWN